MSQVTIKDALRYAPRAMPDMVGEALMNAPERVREQVLKAISETDPLPVHETAVCPRCAHAGVTMRGEQCDCHSCGFRWRWPYVAIDVGLD